MIPKVLDRCGFAAIRVVDERQAAASTYASTHASSHANLCIDEESSVQTIFYTIPGCVLA